VNLPVCNPRFCRVLAENFFKYHPRSFLIVPIEAECDQSPEDLIKICFNNLKADASLMIR
jgi:hypothetical protein